MPLRRVSWMAQKMDGNAHKIHVRLLQPLSVCSRRPTILTFDHAPIGSRLTPRLIRVAARSLRRVLRVLVRSVTGRGCSMAAASSKASAGGKRASSVLAIKSL